MSEFLQAVILGVIEGFTEFLPISSTGHLILANQWMHLEENFANMFNVVIQFGAILSVVVYFWHRINPFSRTKGAYEKTQVLDLWKKTIIGVVPALVFGALLDDFIEEKLFNPTTVSIALVVGGVILIWLESRRRATRINSFEQFSYSKALAVGLFQCLALIPGTSRSAATIIGAMLMGTSRQIAAEFSFFLAIPTMFAASSYKLLKTGISMTAQQWQVLGVGFLVSFLVAWAVIAVFMNYIQRNDFKVFGYYRIMLGAVVLALLA